MAWLNGKEHIGFGIYLDMDAVRKSLHADDQKLLADPKKNARAIVRIFNSKLFGDYDKRLTKIPAYVNDNYQGRDAVKFFRGQSRFRGVCRHKAVIMNAILNRVGVPSETRGGLVDGLASSGHAWVYVPSLDLIADPTEGLLMGAEEYRRVRRVKAETAYNPTNDGFAETKITCDD